MFALLCRLDSSLKASLAHDCGGHEVQLPHPTAENDEEAIEKDRACEPTQRRPFGMTSREQISYEAASAATPVRTPGPTPSNGLRGRRAPPPACHMGCSGRILYRGGGEIGAPIGEGQIQSSATRLR